MQYNPGDGSGIVDEVHSLCDTDSDSYRIEAITRRVNNALETLVSKILKAAGTWQFDDPNYTTNPVGTATLIEGQAKYAFATKFLDIEWVKVKDANGKLVLITPIDQSQLSTSYEEHFGTDSSGNPATGFPRAYDKDADGLQLLPAPTATSVTLTGGLQIKFRRTASLFTTSDTTKEPGIVSPFHILIARMAALPYCATYKKDRVPQLTAQIGSEERAGIDGAGIKDMMEFYSRHEKDVRRIMTPKRIPFI